MKHSLIKLLILFLVLGSCSKDDEVKKYNLNTTAAPAEGGTISPASGSFDSGETFTLTATPSENYEFTNWSGDATGATLTVSVTMDSDKNIVASFTKKDTDGDGITDDLDICNNTPSGEPVDPSGCSDSQKDADGDGVLDDEDVCSNTASGETVDANGCSDSQKDTDGDGITDDIDVCPNTPSGQTVGADGCSFTQKVGNGLIAWYPFNGNAIDESGNGNDLSVFGPILTTDRYGTDNSSYLFDGAQDNAQYLLLDNIEDLKNPTYTYSVWFNTSEFYPNTDDNNPYTYNDFSYQGIISINPNSWSFGPGFSIGLEINKNEDLFVGNWTPDNGGFGTYLVSLVDLNQWYHVVVTLDQGLCKVYVNGVYQQEFYSEVNYDNQFDLGIGGQRNGTAMDMMGGFNGKIDDVGIWNRALSEDEILYLYNN